MEFPESRSDQVAWLESQMVGTELVAIATELQAVHGNTDSTTWSIDSWPTETIAAVRAEGLQKLNDHEFSELLKHPLRLITVQRDVLENGGPYWDRVSAPEGVDVAISAIGETLRRTVDGTANTPPTVTTPTTSKWSKLTWAGIGALATAAALLLTTNLGRPDPDQPIAKVEPVQQVPDTTVAATGWGLEAFANRIADDGALASADRETYLRELATAAEAWSKKKPDTAQALARRIGEFRMGCSAILMANHRPLNDDDKDWLRTRCQSWARALDGHLAAIEAGRPVEDVRADVDSTVTKISAALIGRAETPS